MGVLGLLHPPGTLLGRPPSAALLVPSAPARHPQQRPYPSQALYRARRQQDRRREKGARSTASRARHNVSTHVPALMRFSVGGTRK
jgi:hypothetical protein